MIMTEGPQDHRLNIKVFPLYLFLLGADIKTGQDTTHCVTVRCQTMAERYLVRMIMCYYTVHLVGNVRIFISCTRNTKKKKEFPSTGSVEIRVWRKHFSCGTAFKSSASLPRKNE